jgi:hypothetical protein
MRAINMAVIIPRSPHGLSRDLLRGRIKIKESKDRIASLV